MTKPSPSIKRRPYGIGSVVGALGISAFSSPTDPKTLYREATVSIKIIISIFPLHKNYYFHTSLLRKDPLLTFKITFIFFNLYGRTRAHTQTHTSDIKSQDTDILNNVIFGMWDRGGARIACPAHVLRAHKTHCRKAPGVIWDFGKSKKGNLTADILHYNIIANKVFRVNLNLVLSCPIKWNIQ